MSFSIITREIECPIVFIVVEIMASHAEVASDLSLMRLPKIREV